MILNQPLPTTPFVWRDDPAAFDDFPDFFIAHELAHQWWGQAVGWKNYHEQWLSEGFAQYFAALYAEHQRGPQVFGALLRAVRAVDPGDVRSGAGLSGISARARQGRRADLPRAGLQQGRVRPAHAAAHAGRRRLLPIASGASTPSTGSPRPAPTDLRHAFEAGIGPFAGGASSIAGSWARTCRRCRRRTPCRRTRPRSIVPLKQPATHVFEFPVTVSLLYADGSTEDVTVTMNEAEVTKTLPLKGNCEPSW